MRLGSAIMSEEEVRQEVLRELRADSRLKGAGIEVAVKDGTVTLAGTLATAAELLAALEAARRADGVFDVVNQLSVDADGRRRITDEQIARAVRSALEWDAGLSERAIQVAVSNGWVALHGRVERLREYEAAEKLARRMNGVRGVYNLIEVRPQASPGPENVRDAINEALRRHAEREAESIDVRMRGATADVCGKVHTWTEKQVVLGALRHVPGVERVQDHLTIDPYH